jgi:inner membrane protein
MPTSPSNLETTTYPEPDNGNASPYKTLDHSSWKKFSRGYTFKVLVLIALILLLLIPLSMIRGLVDERGRTARRAESDIMEAWGKQLVEAGPLLVVPVIRTSEIKTRTEKDGEKIEIVKTPFTWVVAPEKLDINADFITEVRRRGIFSVPLFSGELTLSGTFDLSKALADLASNEEMLLDQAELIISLSSQKGIRQITQAQWGTEELFFKPGTHSYNLSLNLDIARILSNTVDTANRILSNTGIYATLPPLKDSASQDLPFLISIAIQGGQSVQVLPIGQDTHVAISADWPSPSFQGGFLPGSSTITDKSFEAQWDISYLSRDIPLFWVENKDSYNYSSALFGVSFFRTIDTYSLNTRAVKYAILFLIVPFFTLFLLEILTKRRIHPVPYILSGIGNVIFYLLLLSFSEQMSFFNAYLIAAIAVTALMTLYSRALLPSWSKSWYMGLVMALSYILLYAVLNAESYALLIGSVGAFVVTALVMFLTRKLDWYGQEQ